MSSNSIRILGGLVKGRGKVIHEYLFRYCYFLLLVAIHLGIVDDLFEYEYAHEHDYD